MSEENLENIKGFGTCTVPCKGCNKFIPINVASGALPLCPDCFVNKMSEIDLSSLYDEGIKGVQCDQGDVIIQSNEMVDHPKHYNVGNIEVIDVIEDWKLGFSLGNAVKYIARAGRKNDKVEQDLEKAIWYIRRYIDKEC